MHRSYLAAAIFCALFAFLLIAAPDLSGAFAHAPDPHVLWSHMAHASIGLVALRSKEKDLVSRAASKLAEITDNLAPDALRAIEADHDKMLDEIEGVRAEIATAETAERSESSAEILRVERERSTGIRTVGRKLGLPEDLVDTHVSRGTALNAFRAIAIDAAAVRQQDPNVSQNPGASDRSHSSVPAAPKGEKPKGTDATRIMIALAATRGSRRDAAEYVTHHYGTDGAVVARALGTSVGSGGGFLVPTEMSAEVIELLRPASTVMALGPRILPMQSGNMTIPGVASGANASYAGENQPTLASQPTFRDVQLSAKKLVSIVPMSNDMIRYPSFQVDAIVRDDMVKSIAMRADLAFLRGQGTQFSPRGLKSFAAAPSLQGNNVLAASVLVGSAYASGNQSQAIIALASVTLDLSRAELALENANVAMSKPGWIMSPRSKAYLMNIRDGLGNQVYYAEMSKGMLRGKPFKTSTQIPNNLAAVATDGTTPTLDGSEIYLADFDEVFIGTAYGLELEVFPGGTYIDASGNTISGVSSDQTVMRAIVQHDMNMRQEAAVAVLTGVRWF